MKGLTELEASFIWVLVVFLLLLDKYYYLLF